MSDNPADDPNFIGKIIDQKTANNAIMYLSDKNFIFIFDTGTAKLAIDDVKAQIPIMEEWSRKYKKIFPLIIDGTHCQETPKEVVDFCLNDERLNKSHSAVIFLNRGSSILECAAMNSFVLFKDFFGGLSNPAKMTMSPEEASKYLFHLLEAGRKIDSLSQLERGLLRLEFFRHRNIGKTAKFYNVDRGTIRTWIAAIYEKLGTGYLYKVGHMIRMSQNRDFFENFDEPKTKDFDIGKYLVS